MARLIKWLKKLLGLDKKPVEAKRETPPDLTPPPLFAWAGSPNSWRSRPQFFPRETTYRTDPAPSTNDNLLHHILWAQMMSQSSHACDKRKEEDLGRTEAQEGYDSGHNAPLPDCPPCSPASESSSPSGTTGSWYVQPDTSSHDTSRHDHGSSCDSSSSSFDSSSSSYDSSGGSF